MDQQDQRTFKALFAPDTIALVGASGDQRKHTSRPQRTLRKHDFCGTIIPINPRYTEISGDRAYPTLADVPTKIDQAFVMVSPEAVAGVIRQCGELRIPVATIYTDGFAEAGGDGRRRQEEVVTIARKGGVRLLGPNCSGIYSSRPSCVLSVNAILESLDLVPGHLALVSQSGSMTGGLMSRGLGRGVGFSKVVSIGNECDLSVGEITEWLVADEETDAILLFLETIRDAPRLARAAHRAVAAGKPVIAYKLGRSDVGRQIAASHTGAMVGSDTTAAAFFAANGILRVEYLETLFELPTMLRGQRPAARHRVAVMTTTGGGAATVVDQLGMMNIEVVAPSERVVSSLAGRKIAIPKGPLTDLTHAGTKAEVYQAVASELLASDHCDLLVAIGGSSSQFQPEVAVDPLIRVDRHGKPLAVFLAPHAETSLKRLADGGVAGFRTPEACADAVRAWARWAGPDAAPPPDATRMAALAQVLTSFGSRKLTELDACTAFAALGIAVASSKVIKHPEDTVDLEFPVAAKVLSADVPHKTDAGGVVLNIKNPAELRAAATSILERVTQKHPRAAIQGILVQPMEQGLAEVILGFRRDPEVGAIVVLGAGGVLAEIYRDIAIRMAPVTPQSALSMIEEVRALATIKGYRGLPRGDCSALAQAVAAFSQLAVLDSPSLREAEINPLLVRREGEGVVAVDGLIIF